MAGGPFLKGRRKAKAMDITLRLQVFEGPLDLLLFLIDRNKVNIYDIPIVEITAQYMEYLEAMKKDDLDVLSEFLVMAATLVDIKCRMLLPRAAEEEEEEEDPRADLVRQLLEYKMYKSMAEELKGLHMDAEKYLFRAKSIPKEVQSYEEPVDLEALCSKLDLDKLRAIFDSVMKRQNEKLDPVRSKFGKIKKEEVSVEEKTQQLKSYARTHRSFSFRQLLEKQHSRVNLVVTFLVILEMMKTGEIRVQQDALFDDITIESNIAEE